MMKQGESIAMFLDRVERYATIEDREQVERYLRGLPKDNGTRLACALAFAAEEIYDRFGLIDVIVSLYLDKEIDDRYILVSLPNFGNSRERLAKLYEVEDMIIEQTRNVDGWIQIDAE